ncbi:methionine--tRNA ligase [Chitinispirillales bacterium ANBcel5]|uniref:methionine--tRNA ligase n=1 Tax=Cellulosispirillum alkaliphilum TaxID=3039283 RepID=UPI002A57A834|nr:methionine--tRNA ligase [Chitinispirillales bacterium ANBcel5]
MPPANEAQKKVVVTSALPYANGDIHLGHLLEVVQTDIFVRFRRLKGQQVLYVCADDTHGTPIELNALRQGITPEKLIERAYKNHVQDYAGFNISFDIFYTTNSQENRQYAELVYKSLCDNNLVEQREISQYYCENDKRFLPDRFVVGTCPKCGAPNQYGDVCEECGAAYEPSDLKNPQCFICGNEPVMKTSKHFYVQLGKKEEFLKQYISSPGVLQEDMRNFVKTWIDEGLREWCISRDGPYFGFKIPDTVNKYFYVWLDAPIGYLSSTDKWCKDNNRSVEEFWGKDSNSEIVHFIGKDIVYFHALFWPVMLESAGFSLPSSIRVHGFLNIEGEKMSKSRGTFILAREFLKKMTHPQASEFLRFYYGAKLSPTTADIDLNQDELISRVNTTLANNIGNLHHRTIVFCERYFDSTIPDVSWDNQIADAVEDAAKKINDAYESCDFKVVIETIHALGSLGNKYYQDSKPWELIKTDKEAAGSVMVTCSNLIKALFVFLKPVMPELSKKIETLFGLSLKWDDYHFSLRNCKLAATEKLVKPLESKDLEKLFSGATINRSKEEVNEEGLIDIDSFFSVDLRVAKIISAQKVKKSNKLLCLQVEMGDQKRQIVAGIAQSYSPDDLPGKLVVAVSNLKPAKIFGLQSQGMLLAAKDKDGSLVLVGPHKDVSSGAKVS